MDLTLQFVMAAAGVLLGRAGASLGRQFQLGRLDLGRLSGFICVFSSEALGNNIFSMW
jgi:hypothetical protein